MKERAIRKMQVPAYWAVVRGVQGVEKRGVFVEVKKVMAMPLEEDISMLSMLSILMGVVFEEILGLQITA